MSMCRTYREHVPPCLRRQRVHVLHTERVLAVFTSRRAQRREPRRYTTTTADAAAAAAATRAAEVVKRTETGDTRIGRLTTRWQVREAVRHFTTKYCKNVNMETAHKNTLAYSILQLHPLR